MYKISQDLQKQYDKASDMFPLLSNFNWEIAGQSFTICNSKVYIINNVIGREVKIESRPQIDGKTLWVVKMDSWVLGEDNKYHFEPMPSSRTDKFISNTRFSYKESALAHLITHEKDFVGKPIPTLIYGR